jgi:hypothetical protein
MLSNVGVISKLKTIIVNLGDDEKMYGVSFTDYVDLLEFINNDMEDQFDEAMRFSSSDDWKEQFFAIDTMRRLNKYTPEILEQWIMKALQFLYEWIHSPRTYLAKNTLIFIQELYMDFRSEAMIEFTIRMIPIIWVKTGHEGTIVKTEARIALQFMAASMAYPECIEELCLHSDSKNIKVKKYVWQALTISIQNLETDPSPEQSSLSQPVSYYLKQPEKFEILFETLYMGLTASKSIEEKEGEKMLKWIGKDVVEEMWMHLFGGDNKHKTKRIMMVFKAKSLKKTSTSGGFKKFLLNKKKATSNNTFADSEVKDCSIVIN